MGMVTASGMGITLSVVSSCLVTCTARVPPETPP